MSIELEILPQKFQNLRDLARAINGRQEEIDAEKEQLVTLANSLGCNVRLQGLDLLRARADIAHGDWLDWLSTHCPKTSERFARVCMAAANRQRVADLDACDTWGELRACLSADQPALKAEPRPWPAAPNLRNLQILTRWSVTIKTAPLEACPPAVLDRYRTLLEPIARLLWPEKFLWKTKPPLAQRARRARRPTAGATIGCPALPHSPLPKTRLLNATMLPANDEKDRESESE